MNAPNDEAMKKIAVIAHDWYTDSISSFEAMEDVVYVLTHDLGGTWVRGSMTSPRASRTVPSTAPPVRSGGPL